MKANKEQIRESTETRCREIKDVANGYLGMKYNIEDLRDNLTVYLSKVRAYISEDDAGMLDSIVLSSNSYIDWCSSLYDEYTTLVKACGRYRQSTAPVWMSGVVFGQYEIDKRYDDMVEITKHICGTLTKCRGYLRNVIDGLSKCEAVDSAVAGELLGLLRYFAIYDSFRCWDEGTRAWVLDYSAVERDDRYHYVLNTPSWLSEV